ncbi:hypothetical protein [Coxiella endosymbiont of Ornithodoros amblus]|uniref:hypothetical protein n=1 Tax=Coxiella endosymbiont of Ornithodoros amblus TaxID=1656166 RepID=UPI00244E0F52|nr:hypothetical protein [Coxiella endosymbiont of Ornithodoros amblus]
MWQGLAKDHEVSLSRPLIAESENGISRLTKKRNDNRPIIDSPLLLKGRLKARLNPLTPPHPLRTGGDPAHGRSAWE